MTDRFFLLTIILGIALLVGWLFFNRADSVWVIHAENPHIIGGYGDNFSYDGKEVRPLEGTLDLRLDAAGNRGTVTLALHTTDTSGPLRVSSERALAGNITLVSQIDETAPIETDVPLFGETGNGGPELPRTFATLTGQSPFDLYVDDRLVYSGLNGHWAVIQALRRNDGAIRQSGLIYSPLLRDKTGFADPKRNEFLLLLRSDAPDPDNSPPSTIALHLVFSQVEIQNAPLKP
jgi:hypothetical protein